MNFRQWLEFDSSDIASYVRNWTDEGPVGQIAARIGKVVGKKLPGQPGGATPYYGKGFPQFTPVIVREVDAGMVSEDEFPLQLPPDYRGQRQFRVGQYRIEKHLTQNRPPDMQDFVELRASQEYVVQGFKSMVGDKLSRMGYHDQVDLKNPSIQRSINDRNIRVRILFRWKKDI